VTSYCFTWCSVMINAFLMVVLAVSFVTGKFYFKDIVLNCNFDLFGENCLKNVTIQQIFLSSYELSRFLK
jgi:hypothetical protein